MDELSDEEADLVSQLAIVEHNIDKVTEGVRSLTPKLLHAFCMYYERLDDVSPLIAALDSTQCDRATATLIYWLSNPVKFAGKQIVSDCDGRDFELFKKAEGRLLSGSLPRRKIKFDPVLEMNYDTMFWQSVRSNPHIPAKLKPKIGERDLLPQWSLFQTFETIRGETCRKNGCVEERIRNGVYCRAHHFEMIFGQLPPSATEESD